ncbi:MAG: efflux RND transporter periplasmic adaptor subunit [Candidatus Mcinerneyibacterium aminivorans]|uniref:Efflux RND transporter periplasmic adaptor subunit n=1 Tax=Candidatus Mcinerneyibacterium aminivorans TaxID=2703815 RepID=A0A5D0MI56_9BACT|nr:MAG: efflux RND transporter periplasmic adaptor subunit [Candidatus Mcinerneyibacterium aminivorans]
MKRTLVYIIIGIMFFACSKKETNKNKNNKKKNNEAVVYISNPERRHLKNYLSYSVSLKAKRDVYVYAPASERIVSIYVKEGDKVNENEVIVEMDNEEEKLKFNKAKTNYTSIKNEYERSKKLYEEGLVSKQEYENILAKYESAKADYEMQKKQLDDLTIRSPIKGIVGRRFVEEKERVQMDQKLFRIVDADILKADINLPEEEYEFVKMGSKVEIFKKGSSEKITGFVNEISPIIDDETGTFRVEVNVKREKGFIPGMFVNLDIITREKEDCLSVPKKAVIEKEDKKGVYVVNDEKAKFVEVTTGIEQEDYVEIIKGLNPEQKVIVVGQNMIGENQRVKVMNQKKDEGIEKNKKKENNENS